MGIRDSYIAARGDRVMGCIMVDTIMLDLSGATDEEVDLLVEETEKQMRGKKGIYGNATAGEGNITTTVGIDFTPVSYTHLHGRQRIRKFHCPKYKISLRHWNLL